ncbi:hypothetical protein B0H14DRAFT_2918401 [Mycena olivaceomarginata]|nr:hypothetical protein B0H14DRAFT_2918401 [Mycena olivaceomarginata]
MAPISYRRANLGFSSIDVDVTPSSLSPPPLGSESDSPPPAHVPPVSPPPVPAPGPAPPPLMTGTTSAHASITPLSSAVLSSADTSPIVGETSSRRTTLKSAGSSSSEGFLCSTSTVSPSSSVFGIVQFSTSSLTSSMTPMPGNTVADTRHRILSPLAIAGVTLASLVAILTLLFILYWRYRANNPKSSIRPASVPFAVEFAHAVHQVIFNGFKISSVGPPTLGIR